MPKCCVSGCDSRYDKNKPQLSFHKIPQNQNRRQKWIQNIGEENLNLLAKSNFVCSLHFEESCFNRTLEQIRLRDDATPSIFPNQPSSAWMDQKNKKISTVDRMAENNLFTTSTAFCARCGSILPLLQEFGSVTCYSCKAIYEADNFSNLKFKYTIIFNTVSVVSHKDLVHMDNPEGPVVERRCPKCGNDRMSYATLQLRSADEGQTVFYTCTSCKYKETENS